MKKLSLAALIVMLVGLVCWLLLTRQKPQRLPALVTLPDGTSLRILAVTYGTNHVVGTKMARMTARLPLGLQDILIDIFGQRAAPAQTITTPTPEMLLWLDHRTNSTSAKTPGSAYYTALLGDGNNCLLISVYLVGCLCERISSPRGRRWKRFISECSPDGIGKSP